MVENKYSSLVTGPVEGKKSWQMLTSERQEIWLQVFQDYFELAREELKGKHNQLKNHEKEEIIAEIEDSLGCEAISKMCKCFGAIDGNRSGLNRLAKYTIQTIFNGLARNKEDLFELRKLMGKEHSCSVSNVDQGRSSNSRPHFLHESDTGCGE